MKKRLLMISLLIIMSLGMAACAETSDVDSQNVIQDNESITDNVSTDNNSETGNNFPKPARVGQIVSGEKWSIALLYAKEYDSIDSEYYSDRPSEGNKFLVLFFDVKNTSSENNYFNFLLFEAYVDDYKKNISYIRGNPDGMSIIGGDLDIGKMSKGYIVYQVPSNWQNFEISYIDKIWPQHKAATFVVNKEDISPLDYVYSNSVYQGYTLDSSKKTEIGTKIHNDKWEVTLIDIKKYNSDGEVITQEADDGKEFVIFYLEAENISSADDYFNALYFRTYVDGYVTGQTLLPSDIDGYSGMSADVAAGKKIKGYVAVQAPIGWNTVELIYDDGVFTGDKVAEFAIENE